MAAAATEGERGQRQCWGFAGVPRMLTTGRGGTQESENGSRIHRLPFGGKFGMALDRVCTKQRQ